jgi:acetylornithine deacetylase
MSSSGTTALATTGLPPSGDAVAMLRSLVAFDTTSRNSNLALVDWMAQLITDAGARIRRTHDDTGRKANLLATFGPDRDGGVLLSAHTDVVPVDHQAWSTDPFVLTERAGRLHGRGTADMKGFIACCLATVQTWGEIDLARPIHLALSYDEEVGCLGVPQLVADLTGNVAPPAFAFIGEPTDMRVAGSHRGFLGFRTTFHGRAAHSSDPSRGENAIAAAARFVCRVGELGARTADGSTATTVSVNLIDGGSAVNIVPSRCEVTWEIRPAADADVAALRAAADELVRRESWTQPPPETVETLIGPPLRPEPDNPAAAMAVRFGAAPEPCDVPFGTEAGFFQAAGIPSVVCGPGSIRQAHEPDEWISRDQLDHGHSATISPSPARSTAASGSRSRCRARIRHAIRPSSPRATSGRSRSSATS